MTAPSLAAPRRARRGWLIVGAGVAVLAVVATVVVLLQPPREAVAGPKAVNVETAVVTRGDLTEGFRAQGTLAYAAPREIGTALPGVVTGFPASGSIVGAGQELFRIDDQPVVLLHGDLPAWRAFSLGMTDGADVLQLERNLAALGFFDREPDEEFAGSTERAVKNWQESLGLEETGAIELGRVVFAQGDVRIQAPKAAIGDAGSAAVVSVTGANKEVLAFVDTAQQGLVAVGTKLTVTLPGGVQAGGTVVSVGAPVERDGGNGKTMKVPVTVTLDDAAATANLDNVSVTIFLTQVKASDVLLVPVVALLARPGGGFAVEVVADDSAKTGAHSSIVPVELGAFADGFVAVTGGKLAEGDTVVVAK
ncbi:multidrug efflux pump subunit AcrA (membrane-fusion protein) [Microterricola gilva]|uniref:Multidrug efflux pump subunit AcrA (Membrane-fusion protein) n=1 Tax=Microterricola gilva TaxID=393267 RepID=A0A4V2GAY4_9MICO|nr:peptidoglycan-binding protein [Microterricola gilva]RZU66116.1 multidrug efflux pump subunit AcrA (membrane-fusion protein) [Microterricola gilva]